MDKMDPEFNFKEIDELCAQQQTLERSWKAASFKNKTAFNAAVHAQLQLNKAVHGELARLRNEFVHFKLNAIVLINGDGPSVVPAHNSETQCVTNPFRLYALTK